jgi:hypothetical protein
MKVTNNKRIITLTFKNWNQDPTGQLTVCTRGASRRYSAPISVTGTGTDKTESLVTTDLVRSG